MNCAPLSLLVCACLTVSGIAAGHDHTPKQHVDDVLLSHQEEKDLELLSSHNQSPGIIDHIDHTKTSDGKESLKKLMRTIVTDITTLKQRQEIINHLHQNPSLLETTQKLLTQAGSHEKALNRIHDTSDQFKQQTVSEFCPPKALTTSTSPLVLDLWQIAHIATVAAPTLEHLAVHYVLNKGIKDFLGITCGHSHHKKKHSHSDSCDHHKTCHHDHSPKSEALKRIAHTAYNVGHAGLHIVGLIGLAKQVKSQFSLLKTIQCDLIETRQVLEAIHTLNTVIETDPVLSTAPEFAKLNETLKAAHHTKKLHQLLSASTFKGQASLRSRPGNILAGYKLAQSAQEEVRAILQCVGSVDALVSLAQAYHASQDKEHRYTFATYEHADTPSLEITQAWHPLIPQEHTSSPDITLGTNAVPRVAIVTGDNMAGKSTALKMAALNALFAQTCSFAPAKALRLTPFQRIKTSLSLTDSIKEDISSFGAELISAGKIVAACDNQQPGFTFVAVDELFVKTNAERGQAELKQFIKTVSTQGKVLGLIATHYTGLTTLVTENLKALAHYLADKKPATDKNKKHRYFFQRIA